MSTALEQLNIECLSCDRCSLCVEKTNLVFGVGNESADIMFVGEGPGEKEDLQGEPFVGPAGQLLDVMLELIDLNREKVYITNVIKCRPPRNRDPLPGERKACREWLDRQISIVNPKIIVCLGRYAAMDLISEEFRITVEHGEWFTKDGRRLIALYHPSALLRDESKRPSTFEDLVKIREAYQCL